jgi:hypothetical protein
MTCTERARPWRLATVPSGLVQRPWRPRTGPWDRIRPTCRENEVLSFKFVGCLLSVLFWRPNGCRPPAKIARRSKCLAPSSEGLRTGLQRPLLKTVTCRTRHFAAVSDLPAPAERVGLAAGTCLAADVPSGPFLLLDRTLAPGGSPPCRPGLCISVTIHGLV